VRYAATKPEKKNPIMLLPGIDVDHLWIAWPLVIRSHKSDVKTLQTGLDTHTYMVAFTQSSSCQTPLKSGLDLNRAL